MPFSAYSGARFIWKDTLALCNLSSDHIFTVKYKNLLTQECLELSSVYLLHLSSTLRGQSVPAVFEESVHNYAVKQNFNFEIYVPFMIFS